MPPISFHSESSILTTLFALLFWPILYKDIPGAFETPYQLAPLDLGDDSFYQSRRDDIEDRLERMTRKGEALKMLREADGRERDRGTLGIGVRWDFGREDLEEIVQVSCRACSIVETRRPNDTSSRSASVEKPFR
jgi:Fanconi-associated nuclease 1